MVVTLFMVSGTRRDFEAGRIAIPNGFPDKGGLLSRSPRQGWSLGLTIGVVAALVITPLTFGLFRLLGVTVSPFRWVRTVQGSVHSSARFCRCTLGGDSANPSMGEDFQALMGVR